MVALAHSRRPLVLLLAAFAALAAVGWGIRRRIALEMHLEAPYTDAEERLLHCLSPQAIEDLVRTLKSDPDKDRRSIAGDALGKCRERAALDALLEANGKEDPSSLGNAENALWGALCDVDAKAAWMRTASVEEALARIRATRDPLLRGEMFESFVQQRGDLLVPLARVLLATDPDWGVTGDVQRTLCGEDRRTLFSTRVPTPAQFDVIECLRAGLRNPEEMTRDDCKRRLARYTDEGITDEELCYYLSGEQDRGAVLRILGYLDKRGSPEATGERGWQMWFTKDPLLAQAILDGLDAQVKKEAAGEVALRGLENQDPAIRAASEKWLTDRGVEIPEWRRRK